MSRLAERDLAAAFALVAERMRYATQPHSASQPVPPNVQQATFVKRNFVPMRNSRLATSDTTVATALLLTPDYLFGVGMELTWPRMFGRRRWVPQQVVIVRRATSVFVADTLVARDRSMSPSFTIGFRDVNPTERDSAMPAVSSHEEYTVIDGWLWRTQALVAALPQI